MRSPARSSTPSKERAPGELGPTTGTATPQMGTSADLSPASSLPTSEPTAPGDLDRGHRSNDDHSAIAPVDLGGGRCRVDTQPADASADLDGDRTTAAAHAVRVPVSSNGTDHPRVDTLGQAVGAEPSSNGHARTEVHTDGAVGSDESGHKACDTRSGTAASSDESSGDSQASSGALRMTASPEDALLVILADQLDDIEKARIAAENRLRSLDQVKGLVGSKAEATLQVITGEWKAAEKRITLELKRAMRAHRFGPWVAGNVGLGEKQAGRLIAAIGDPYMRPRLKREDGTVEEARPRRGPAELWAYCGYRPDQGKRKGQLHSYSWEAKMRAFLCAESCKRQRCGACTEASKARKADGWAPPPAGCTCAADGFPFRVVYDRERLKWEERGVPDAHKEAHALRVVAKEILKSLWRYAANHLSTPESGTPPATGQLRTAKLAAEPNLAPPSDLPATSLAATPGPTPSPASSEVSSS